MIVKMSTYSPITFLLDNDSRTNNPYRCRLQVPYCSRALQLEWVSNRGAHIEGLHWTAYIDSLSNQLSQCCTMSSLVNRGPHIEGLHWTAYIDSLSNQLSQCCTMSSLELDIIRSKLVHGPQELAIHFNQRTESPMNQIFL
jgi:hypothetical protein